MQSSNMTPVLIIGYKRPELFEQVAKEVERLGLKNIYIALDAPRSESDINECEETLKIAKKVFPDSYLNRAVKNLGCGERINSALDWVFEKEQRVIIIEDDCLPGKDFFLFCTKMLDKFAEDERIGFISGCNLVNQKNSKSDSVFLSKFGGIWGWATWKRAWVKERLRIDILKEILYRENKVSLFESGERLYWEYFLNQIGRGKLDTWDYQWDVDRMSKGMLCVVSEHNLIRNIGFTEQGTNIKPEFIDLFTKEIAELPEGWDSHEIVRNRAYEKEYFQQLIEKNGINKIKMWIVNFLWKSK